MKREEKRSKWAENLVSERKSWGSPPKQTLQIQQAELSVEEIENSIAAQETTEQTANRHGKERREKERRSTEKNREKTEKPVVLVAVSDPVVAATVKAACEVNNWHVVVIESGTQATRYLQEHNANIERTVIELNLPGLSGHNLLRKAKELGQKHVVVVSNHAGVNAIQTSYKLGAELHLNLPAEVSELREAFANLPRQGVVQTAL